MGPEGGDAKGEMNEMCWKSYGCQSALQAAAAEQEGKRCRFISSLWKRFCRIMLRLHYYSPALSNGTDIITAAQVLPI